MMATVNVHSPVVKWYLAVKIKLQQNWWKKNFVSKKFLTKASVSVILGLLKLSMVILDSPTQNSGFGGSSNVAMFFVYFNFDDAKMYQKFKL